MLVFAALLGGILPFIPKSISHDKISQITEGMTESQVTAKLGPPYLKDVNVWGYRYFGDSVFRCTFFIRFDAKKKVEVFVSEIDNMPAGFPPAKHGRNSDKWVGPPN